MNNLQRWLEVVIKKQWQNPSNFAYLFAPLNLFFLPFSYLNRAEFDKNSKVILVANAIAGGSGKTPIVMEIAKMAAKTKKRIAIIVRGFPLNPPKPMLVEDDNIALYGDEACMIYRELVVNNHDNIDIYVTGSHRNALVKSIHEKYDHIIADDGFQTRGFKFRACLMLANPYRNNLLLPLGPVRTPRLFFDDRVDCIIRPDALIRHIKSISFANSSEVSFDRITKIYIVTAIARPERFVNSVKEFIKNKYGSVSSNLQHIEHPDHHDLTNVINGLKLADSEVIVVPSKNFSPAITNKKLAIAKETVEFNQELKDFITFHLKIT